MKTTFNKLTTKFGCYAENDHEENKYLPNETFTISDVLDADVPLKDKAWFIRKNCEFTATEFREFAIGCALIVLPIYEEKYPGNKAPREAIEATQEYIKGTIGIDVLRVKRRAAATAAYAYAADAAAATADADYAADAAAYAAYAYAYAADAAAATADAYAADYAAAAAADAADAENGNYKLTLLNFFKEFVK